MKLALAVATGCTAAALLYSILRVAQAVLLTEPDPTTVAWSEHSGFFWRAWTCAYVGGALAILAHRIASKSLARWLAGAIVPVALIVVAQALFVP
jgi:hypothetical protein